MPDIAPNIEPGKGRLVYDKMRRTIAAQKTSDAVLLDRALAILHRMATEHTGWRRYFLRWYYSDEPLRNDAANLVREAGFGMPQPIGTKLIGEDDAYFRGMNARRGQCFLTRNGKRPR